MDYAIQSKALSCRYGKRDAVMDLDLTIHAGRITAFLGPNGAGKTTTIRLLLGLLRPSKGTCEVLGLPPGHKKALAQLGAMVESPSLYDHLTGRENLEITRLMRNAPRSEIDRVLGMVGLTADAMRPVAHYSLGMRQRLGLALAMMGDPKLLILDEPTNGLDPEGIHEMREMIRRLPSETGATVFISSHILAEMEQLATDVVVISRGKMRYQGPLDAMEALDGLSNTKLLLKASPPDKTEAILAQLSLAFEREKDYFLVDAPAQDAARIAQNMVKGGVDLWEMTPRRRNLEDRFLALVEEP